MTMTVDNTQQRQFGGGMNFDPLSYPMASNPPQFTNPWTSSTVASQSHGLYAPPQTALNSTNLGLDGMAKPQPARSNMAMTYASIPSMTAPSAGSSLGDAFADQQELTLAQDMMTSNRMPPYGSEAPYASTASPHTAAYTATTTSTPYDSMGYAPAPMRSTFAMPAPGADASRRLSQPLVLISTTSLSDLVTGAAPSHIPYIDIDDDRSSLASDSGRSFGDAIDASRGMIAMSQDTTPRNIYGPGHRSGRGSADSYGFPSTHSTSSSISSSSDYPQYFGGASSVHSSISDYSNAGSDIESVSSRTLPRPATLMHTSVPPAPQSMMGQFSSKVSSSTQKKHKCKVCDKRFTRPSSLQTHMYSHTGEKPFHCKVEGCGRNFSVVSNLRRHRKVHKGEAPSDAGSDGHHSD